MRVQKARAMSSPCAKIEDISTLFIMLFVNFRVLERTLCVWHETTVRNLKENPSIIEVNFESVFNFLWFWALSRFIRFWVCFTCKCLMPRGKNTENVTGWVNALHLPRLDLPKQILKSRRGRNKRAASAEIKTNCVLIGQSCECENITDLKSLMLSTFQV